jgi:multimeric flavodoxin WrbA
MARKIVILKGSPRAKGNSSVLADAVAEGAEAAGAEVESFILHGMDIRPCRGCDGCVKTGVCVIKDDMRVIGPKLQAADAIVLASPVYWFTFSAQLKLCIDRWYALWHPRRTLFRKKSVGIVLAYGDTDLATSGGKNAVATYKSMFGFLGSTIVGIVHGSLNAVGEAERNLPLMRKARALGVKLALPAASRRSS